MLGKPWLPGRSPDNLQEHIIVREKLQPPNCRVALPVFQEIFKDVQQLIISYIDQQRPEQEHVDQLRIQVDGDAGLARHARYGTPRQLEYVQRVHESSVRTARQEVIQQVKLRDPTEPLE